MVSHFSSAGASWVGHTLVCYFPAGNRLIWSVVTLLLVVLVAVVIAGSSDREGKILLCASGSSGCRTEHSSPAQAAYSLPGGPAKYHLTPSR